jgi:hypothetical protein
MQEAMSSHLLEMARQLMLGETADELPGWYGDEFCGAG